MHTLGSQRVLCGSDVQRVTPVHYDVLTLNRRSSQFVATVVITGAGAYFRRRRYQMLFLFSFTFFIFSVQIAIQSFYVDC